MALGRLGKFTFRTSLLAVCSLVCCSCAGDPTRGGIFWSEPKAKQRLAVLRDQLSEEQKLLAEARSQRARARTKLDREISSARRQFASAKLQNPSLQKELTRIEGKREALSSSNAESPAEVQAERDQYAALQREVEQLREKNKALQTGL
jgi:chromosome segregation ATPase